MKFNKSAESDFWYVEGDDGLCIGRIKQYENSARFIFEPTGLMSDINFDQMMKIANFLKKLEKEHGIDTTSTFTSNSQ